MAVVSEKYLQKVEKHIMGGIPIERMNMTAEQKLRTIITFEAYQMWISNKIVDPVELCRRISERTYSQMLFRAAYDPEMAEFCRKAGITAGRKRSPVEISNDVRTLDFIIGRFHEPVANIERAKVVQSSDWLIRYGMTYGNDRSVSSGAKLKMALYRDFDEKEQNFDRIAETDVNITGDVSVIKAGQVNLTEEELEAVRKRYKINKKEAEDLFLNENGEYETAASSEPDDVQEDFFR